MGKRRNRKRTKTNGGKVMEKKKSPFGFELPTKEEFEECLLDMGFDPNRPDNTPMDNTPMTDDQRVQMVWEYMKDLKFDCKWEFHNVNDKCRRGQGIFIDIFNDTD